MRISNNNTECSRHENFDLTRMFSKQCFCDSNIPDSHGWLHLNHFPRPVISNTIQKLNASIFWNRETVDMQEIVDLVSPLVQFICGKCMLDCARNYPISNLSRHWKQRTEIWLSLWLKWRQSLKRREIHSEENVINSLQPVITITQRKDIKYCIFINMFSRRENIKRINIFQYFLRAL